MVWRGSTSTGDRIFSVFPYLMPAAAGVELARTLIANQPWLRLFLAPLLEILQFFSPVLNAPTFLVFVVLYFAVVRNTNIPRFIRYNTALALVADIALSLVSMTFSLMMNLFGELEFVGTLVEGILSPLVGLAAIVFFGYAVIQVVRGKYAEIAAFSPSAYSLTQDG
ncbi:MAG: Tic20 family protein [Cyanobacteria bacterium J06648_11]